MFSEAGEFGYDCYEETPRSNLDFSDPLVRAATEELSRDSTTPPPGSRPVAEVQQELRQAGGPTSVDNSASGVQE